MEMEPWRFHNAYDRPIARRIAETSGVNREAFGMTKKRVAQRFYQLPMNHSLRTKFLAYLRDTKGLGFIFAQTYNLMDTTTILIQKALYRIKPSSSHKALIQFWSHFDFGSLMWIWATHLLRDRFRRVLLDRGFGKLFR
jgi:hypothetical protein